MNLGKRIDKLESAVVKHLMESGEIQASIKSATRAIYGLYGFIGLIIVAAVTAGLDRLWK